MPHRLVLVRHAESARQVAKIGRTFYADDESRRPVQGVPDQRIPLTERGRQQCIETGHALRAHFGPFNRIYYSPYLRARETLSGILAAFDEAERAQVKFVEDFMLRERDDGYGHDMTEREAAAAFPWLHDYWQSVGPFYGRPPGGESLAQVVERIALFRNRLLREAGGENVLVIAHGGSIRCLRLLLEGWTVDEMERQLRDERMPNCAVTWYDRDTGEAAFTLRGANIDIGTNMRGGGTRPVTP